MQALRLVDAISRLNARQQNKSRAIAALSQQLAALGSLLCLKPALTDNLRPNLRGAARYCSLFMAHNSTTAPEVPTVLSAQQDNTKYTWGVGGKE